MFTNFTKYTAVGDLSKHVSATGYNWSVRVENS